MEKLNLTQEWDKVFPKSDKVDHKKVTFHNRYVASPDINTEDFCAAVDFLSVVPEYADSAIQQ